MNNNKNLIVGAIIAALVIFLIYTTWLLTKPTQLEIQGHAEATQMKISSKVTGRIDSLAVKRGNSVKKGDLLFVIESPEVEAKLNQAEAVKLAAEAQSLKAETGARQEDIQAAHNTYLKAAAAYEYAQKSHQRIKNLYAQGVVPAQKMDEMDMQLKVAYETSLAAKSIWDKAKSGARLEDKSAAEAMVKQAEAVIAEVSSYLNETQILAPMDGEVANLLAERGELTPAGFPVITLIDLNDIWFVFNIREDLLANMRMGSTFQAQVPALGNIDVELTISYIAPLGDFATWNATKTSGDFDMKTFEVHARPTQHIDGLRPGMSALVDGRSIINQ